MPLYRRLPGEVSQPLCRSACTHIYRYAIRTVLCAVWLGMSTSDTLRSAGFWFLARLLAITWQRLQFSHGSWETAPSANRMAPCAFGTSLHSLPWPCCPCRSLHEQLSSAVRDAAEAALGSEALLLVLGALQVCYLYTGPTCSEVVVACRAAVVVLGSACHLQCLHGL